MTSSRLARRRGSCIASVASCLAAVGCDRPANTFAPPPPPEVVVAHPGTQTVTRYIESTGTTEAFESVELRARVSGFLEQFLFKPGDVVHKGDLLFVIDKRTYEATANQAEAALAEQEARLHWVTTDFNRSKELRETGTTSQFELEQKQSTMQETEAKVAAAKATLRSAQLDLDFCEVRAPFDGRITKNFVDVGNLVGAGGQPTVLARIVRSKPLYVTLDTSERDLMTARRQRLATSPEAKPGEVAPGVWRSVRIAAAGRDDFAVEGHVDYVDPQINAITGTAQVRCRFENVDDSLLPGMFVRVRVLLDSAPSLLVPDICLLSDQGGRLALVVNDKDVVEARHVKTGALDGEMRVVTEGLSETDRVVVNGLYRARPGATVKTTLVPLAIKTATTQVAVQPTTTRADAK